MGTAISWTNETWNPTTGCSRVNEGCRNCYAERLSLERGWSKVPWTHANAKDNVVLHPDRLRKPRTWKQPSRVFVNSMSDLFHPLIPDDYIRQVFDVMAAHYLHTFQVLTKRPERAATWPGPWPANIWMGTSVADQKSADVAVPHLLRCQAQTLFLSMEPLIESVTIQRALWPQCEHCDEIKVGVDGLWSCRRPGCRGRELHADRRVEWVIVGGESGPDFRPMRQAWARAIRDECVEAGVAFFYKQAAAYRTETRPWLYEEDGSAYRWAQYPGHLAPPELVFGPDPVRAATFGNHAGPLSHSAT